MGALLRAVPTRKSFPRGGVSRGHGAQHRRVDRNIRQAPLPTLRRISLSRFSFLLSLPSFSYSLFAFSFATPMRRWRSAGGAQVHARHPSRHAMTGMQTPLSDRHRPPRPPCDHCAPRASPACDRFPQTGQARLFFANRASPTCVRAVRRLAFPATGRSPFGAPRGISGPGPCLPLSGSPSRIVRQPHMPHGSSLPGGAGLANLPGAVANRLRGHHSLAPTCRIASRSAPHERG